MRFGSKQAVGCFFLGAAAGAVIALLYAPKTGAQTRKNVRRFTRNTVDRLDDLQGGIRNQLGGWVEDVTDMVKGSGR